MATSIAPDWSAVVMASGVSYMLNRTSSTLTVSM